MFNNSWKQLFKTETVMKNIESYGHAYCLDLVVIQCI